LIRALVLKIMLQPQFFFYILCQNKPKVIFYILVSKWCFYQNFGVKIIVFAVDKKIIFAEKIYFEKFSVRFFSHFLKNVKFIKGILFSLWYYFLHFDTKSKFNFLYEKKITKHEQTVSSNSWNSNRRIPKQNCIHKLIGNFPQRWF